MQRVVGRDHNPNALSVWMAGPGIPSRQVIGENDEFGFRVVKQPVAHCDLIPQIAGTESDLLLTGLDPFARIH